MKVQMITLAALAAASLSAQGVAQQGEQSLERALADLNDGLTAPAGSSSYDISGDARLRNLYISGGTSKDVDTRARLNFEFNVNENAGAVVSFLGFEHWGTQVADTGTGSKTGLNNVTGLAPGHDTRIDQAYYWAHDMFGDGGTATLGRKYFTVGSGRILGSDDWDQSPNKQTGLWYSHEAGGLNFQAFFLNSQDDAGAGGGLYPSEDYFGFTFDYVFEGGETMGDIHISPYLLSTRDNGITLEDGFYLGAEFSGSLAGFGWGAEWAKLDENDAGVGGGSAYVLNTTIGLDALESIPGVEDGSLLLQITGADDDFMPLAPVYHGVAGLRDALGRGGIWTPDTDTLSAHLGFAPGENWNGMISYYGVEVGAADFTEWDIQFGTTLVDAVDLWFGYAHTASDDGLTDDDALWAVVALPF